MMARTLLFVIVSILSSGYGTSKSTLKSSSLMTKKYEEVLERLHNVETKCMRLEKVQTRNLELERKMMALEAKFKALESPLRRCLGSALQFDTRSMHGKDRKAKLDSAGCVWDLNTQLPFNEPIYLTVSGEKVEFAIPDNSEGLHVNQNEPFLLLCPGKNNVISQTEFNEATVRCAEEQNVFLGPKKTSLEQLDCAKNSMGDGLITDVSCGNGGHIIKLGYNTTLGWVNLINACYDDQRAAALFSEHTIYGSAMGGSSKQSLRPSFHSFGVPKDIHPAQAYSQRGQIKTLSKSLEKSVVDGLIKGSSYLARGHLAPDADFLYGSWQFTTYFYVNAVPQWQQVNNGNWKKLEILVRKASISLGHNLRVLTGSFEVMSLPSLNGDVPVYLADDDRLPVPKWTWKIIQSEVTKEAIAFATLNNPFTLNLTKSEVLCKSICQTTNWQSDEWENFAKGYTVCCKVGDLVKAVGDIPDINDSGILKGPL